MVRQAIENLKDAMPNLRTKILLPGAGHWIQQERPTEVNKLLIEFLAGGKPTKRSRARDRCRVCGSWRNVKGLVWAAARDGRR